METLQAVTVTSRRALRQREANKKQRQERHRANEEARPADKRLTTRDDFDKHAQRVLARATLIQYAHTVRFFAEFCTDILDLPDGTGESYFKPHGPLPNTKMMRQFIFYLADGGKGHSPNGKWSRTTAVGNTINLFGALAFCNRRVEGEIREQVLLWVCNDLTSELELNKGLVISKPIAYRQDVSLVIRELYSPLGLRQVLSMRSILYVNIFINLMVDTCSRIHEIVTTIAYPEQFLKWRDLRVFVRKINGQVRVSALLKVSGLKGMKDRPEAYKEIPLNLLPSSLCFEDSLRLLLIAALIEGHVPGCRTWAELEAFMAQCDTDAGVLMPLHESCLDYPLIPRIRHTLGEVWVESPAKPDFIPRELERLGRLCGFRDILKSNALRRGAGYYLEMATTPENRRLAMGHKPGSFTYEKYYKGRTATFDIQSIMHRTDHNDVLWMSSMSLGRVKNAPTKLFEAGEQKAISDPKVAALNEHFNEALDALTSHPDFTTMHRARENNSPEYEMYHEAGNAYKTLLRTTRKRLFKEEYNEFVRTNSTLASLQHPNPSIPADVIDTLPDDSGIDMAEGDTDSSIGVLGTLETGEFERIAGLRREEDAEFDALVGKEIVSLDKESKNNLDEPTQPPTEPNSSRLHGIYRYFKGQRLHEGAYAETHVLKPHRFDTIYNELVSIPSLTDKQVSDLLIPFFHTMHPIERYGKLEPEAGTLKCTTCENLQASKEDFDDHVVRCRRQNALETAEAAWEQVMAELKAKPCNWLLKYHGRKRCQKTFTENTKFSRHVLQHSWRNTHPYCYYGDCAELDEATAPQYHSRDDWANHLTQIHGLTSYASSASTVFFCAFCDDYVSLGMTGPAVRIDHYASHLNEALDAVQKFGYNEVWSTVGGLELLRVRHPWFCIFCLHDENANASERISVCNERTGHVYVTETRDHLLKHFLSFTDPQRCPASVARVPLCGSTETYDAKALEKHLVEVHYIYDAEGLTSAKPKPQRVRDRRKKKPEHISDEEDVEEQPRRRRSLGRAKILDSEDD